MYLQSFPRPFLELRQGTYENWWKNVLLWNVKISRVPIVKENVDPKMNRMNENWYKRLIEECVGMLDF